MKKVIAEKWRRNGLELLDDLRELLYNLEQINMKEFLIKESELSHWLHLTSHATANADIKVLAELISSKLGSVPYREFPPTNTSEPKHRDDLPF